jgi:ABC-type sulfate transport system permease component
MNTLMNSLGSADYVAIALAVGGLAAVLWEVAVKHPRGFLEMITDSRAFAALPLTQSAAPATNVTALPVATPVAPMAAEEHRLAA